MNTKKILLAVLLVVSNFIFSQEAEKFRVGIDLGWTLPVQGGGGFMGSIEPKYNVADNMNIGLRYSGAIMAKDVKFEDAENSNNLKIAGNGSLMATYDYYFNDGSSRFAPYVGGGIGGVKLANISLDGGTDASPVAGTDNEYKPKSTYGGLLRAGFEYGKFRMGIEYNLIPKTEIKGGELGLSNGEVKNSYFAFHIGFYFGGGKWMK